MTSAVESSETVYTFSFTVDWFHTVHIVALTRTPAKAAASRAQRIGTTSRIQRSATRNQSPAESALVSAAKRLMRAAYDSLSGRAPKRMRQHHEERIPRRMRNPQHVRGRDVFRGVPERGGGGQGGHVDE